MPDASGRSGNRWPPARRRRYGRAMDQHERVAEPDQERLDERVQEYYSGRTGWDEHARLTTLWAQGRVEHTRTQELVRARLAPGARVLDVGGATGVHAAPLAEDGYDVLLVDPVPSQVARAAEHGTFEARVGDARDLAALGLADDSFDAVLLLGPLYHLARREDRLRALREAVRVTRPGGTVAAAAITRLGGLVGRGYELFPPSAWYAMLTQGCRRRCGSRAGTSTTRPSSPRRQPTRAWPTSSCTASRVRRVARWSACRATTRARPSSPRPR
nr:hypothetical protein GCM10025730_03730 [Promicromonospora thailandica]